VHKTRGNLNNLVGVPMTLLELSDAHDTAVVEMGTNRPGEIARLADIARPDVGVVTLVAAAHTEGLGSIEAVAREKWALIEALQGEARAVINADDPSLGELAGSRPEILSFGYTDGATVRIAGHELLADLSTRARYVIEALGELEVPLALLGEAAARNAAGALAVCVALGRDVHAAAAGLASVKPEAGRMCPVTARSGALVLDDTYNANPRSTALALDTAAELAAKRGGSVIAVLGDMKELGDRSNDEHAAIGRHAAAAGVRLLAACGLEMRHAVSAARRASPTMEVHHYDDLMEAAARVLDESARRDVIVVKGSRSMQMERVVAGMVS
jgi:UDP-N-acetylmuramoyl-tripeptide--D-alanyl-D-alanine ligase